MDYSSVNSMPPPSGFAKRDMPQMQSRNDLPAVGLQEQEKGGDKALEKVVMKDVRRLFPEKRIPNPEFFRSHPWKTGCTYWLPGDYNPEKVSEESCHPLPSKLPNVYMCGESWSMRQAWVEGALEQTKRCLSLLRP